MRGALAGATIALTLVLSGCALPIGFSVDDDASVEPKAEELVVPDRFTIIPDEWQAANVGRLGDGRHYFLTADFTTSKLYISVYYWKVDGSFDEADITPLGDADEFDGAQLDRAIDQRRAKLDRPTIEAVTVEPFGVEHDGVQFGFVASGPAADGYEVASVSHLPNDDMVYYWPWDGEGYDT